MCTSNNSAEAVNLFPKSAVTLVELFIVLVIIAIVATLGIAGWNAQVEREAGYNAKATLTKLWQAEQNYFAWQMHNAYWHNGTNSSDFSILEIDDPNNDKFYNYTIEEANHINLTIKATRKGNLAKWFSINQTGNITSNPPGLGNFP